MFGGLNMKKHFHNFFYQYRLLVLFNIIMIISTVFSSVMGDIYVVQNEVLSYNLHSIFVLRILPVYSLLYGIVSYAIYKKIRYPQLLLLTTLVLSFLFAELISLDISGLIVGFFILTPCYMVVSFVGIAVILIPCKLINEIKENK